MSAMLDGALELLQTGVDHRVTPGAALAVAWRRDGRWQTVSCGVGTLAWDGVVPVTDETLYDLASVTKPFVAMRAAQLAQEGLLELGAPLGSLLPAARSSAAGSRSLDALLSHRAGLAAWRPLFTAVPREALGTPEARTRILHEALQEVPAPGGTEVYSDLGYILAGAALEAVTGSGLDQLLHGAPGVGALRYGPVEGAGCAPTERCIWRGRVLQGEVHDENAFAMGGVAGHAGLFGTARAVAQCGTDMLDALREGAPWALAMLAPRAGGTHRLGWDTKRASGSTAGSRMGPATFGHLGFTGTSIWCDPAAEVVIVLLTNRVHPSREGPAIHGLRVGVHDAVMDALVRSHAG